MIYLDNAATSFKKPKEVGRALYDAMINFGANAGRGGHKLSAKAAETVYNTRVLLAEFFSAKDESQIAFFPNTTYALNAAIYGVLANGGHAVISPFEHNSVIRPLAELKKQKKVAYSIAKCNENGKLDIYSYLQNVRSDTKLFVITGASNVCGNMYDYYKIAELAHSKGIYVLLDAAQVAGTVLIDASSFDMVAFPGHKGLLGPQGSGGLYVKNSITLTPLYSGGTGSMSEDTSQPTEMPDRLESGTLNMPAIAGLGAGLRFIQKVGINNIYEHEMRLSGYAYDALKNMKNVTCYGDFETKNRVGVLSFNINGKDSVALANELDEKYNICVRGGLHCSPLCHNSLGTTKSGTVRMSFGYFNTIKEVKFAIDSIYKLSKNLI